MESRKDGNPQAKTKVEVISLLDALVNWNYQCGTLQFEDEFLAQV